MILCDHVVCQLIHRSSFHLQFSHIIYRQYFQLKNTIILFTQAMDKFLTKKTSDIDNNDSNINDDNYNDDDNNNNNTINESICEEESQESNELILNGIQNAVNPISFFSSKELCYYKRIDKFFRNCQKTEVSQMLDIITGTSNISLRILDFFVTRYSKKKTDFDDENTLDTFDVHISYKSELKSYKKKYFDPFRRRRKFYYPFDIVYKKNDKTNDESCDNNTANINTNNNDSTSSSDAVLLYTTLGQLNFFRWAITNKIVSYVAINTKDIIDTMNKCNKDDKKKHQRTSKKKTTHKQLEVKTDKKGLELRGVESKGTELKGIESKGIESKGTESKGTESKGTESKGTESKGTETRGQKGSKDLKGIETKENNVTNVDKDITNKIKVSTKKMKVDTHKKIKSISVKTKNNNCINNYVDDLSDDDTIMLKFD